MTPQPQVNVQTLYSSVFVVLFAFATLSNNFATVQALRYSKCPHSRDLQMDECAVKMGFLGDHSFTVPKNVSSMEKYCQNLKESIACIQSYSRDCLQGFTKQILNSLLKRGKQQYSLLCQDENAQRDFMAKMSCLTDDKIEQFHLCMDASIARFELIGNQVKADSRLPSLCCSYQLFSRDLDQVVEKACGKTGSTREYLHKLVGGTTGEFMQLVCEDHKSVRDCLASPKTKDTFKRLEQVTNQARQGKLKPRNKSLIPPLLVILDTHSSD